MGNNFSDYLFGFLFQNEVYSLKKEFSPWGANFFLKELTPTEKGGKMKMAELILLKVNSYPLWHMGAP